MNKDKSLKSKDEKLIFLVIGNSQTGKKTICKEIMRRHKITSEENKTFYTAYNFNYEDRIMDRKISIPIEFRVMNGNYIR